MKTRLASLALIATFSLVGCETIANYQPRSALGKSVKTFWSKAETQEGIRVAGQFVLATGRDFAAQMLLAGLRGYTTGTPMTLGSVASEAGIRTGVATLYTQANYLRTIQGTNLVLDPVATADLLVQGGTPEELSRKLAANLFDNATEMIRRGASPNQAAEANAAGFDKAAADLTAKLGAPIKTGERLSPASS